MTRQDQGIDFASAAMMRLISTGLARRGIAAPPSSRSSPWVPRTQKLDTLTPIMNIHGPSTVLSIADAIREVSPEPVLQALSSARDTGDLLERWRRLERFSHGRHTIEFNALDDGSFSLVHRARDAGPPPSRAESFLVLGVLTILSEIVNATAATLTADDGTVWRKHGAWRELGRAASIGRVVLTAQAEPRMLEPIGAESGYFATRLRERVAADPARRWTVAELAAEAGASPRTLQRLLAAQSASFSRLVGEARLQVAASHLCDANGPGLAEIGFIAGYADQAHFARSFKSSVGTTPGRYRADFAT